MSEDGAHSIRSVLNWVEGSASEGWFWRADATHNTLLGILNTDTEEAEVAVSLDYYLEGQRRSYELPNLTIPPRVSELVDVGAIIAAAQPDADGDVIPAGVSVGGYKVRKVGPRLDKPVVTEALVYDRRTKSFETFYNTCCGYKSVSVSPLSLSGGVGAGGQLTISARDGCTAETFDLTYSGSYSSTNTAVAPVNTTAWVSYLSVGSATERSSLSYDRQSRCYVGGCTCVAAVLNDDTPAEVIRVQVTTADIVADRILVSLEPTNLSGALVVTARGSSVSKTIFNGTVTGGNYTYSFDRTNLPVGQYTTVTAQWTVSGVPHTGSKPVSFNVLGSYLHSQYNTPAESACTGSPGSAYITNSSCAFSSTTLKSDFISQSWLNGSGKTINYGIEQNEAFCLSHQNAPADASGRSFRPQAIVPSCGAAYSVNNSTVARGDDAPLVCGDSVLIVGLGAGATTKTVTDRCPSCTEKLQLDNYTTQAACQPGTIPSLGTFKTIRLR